jgi:cytoskeletal protein CcmA (bactofilin family)
MSIFRRDSEAPGQTPQKSAAPRPAPRSAPVEAESRDRTYIAKGSKVVGEISGSAELVIDGRVEGKIDLGSRLVVGSTGEVEGELQARSIQIGGRVLGNVHGLERVEVLKSGRLEGDMVAPQNGVHIAEGAFFSGKIDMTRAAADKAAGDKAAGDKAAGDQAAGGKAAGDKAARPPAAAPPAPRRVEPAQAKEDPRSGEGSGGGSDMEKGQK